MRRFALICQLPPEQQLWEPLRKKNELARLNYFEFGLNVDTGRRCDVYTIKKLFDREFYRSWRPRQFINCTSVREHSKEDKTPCRAMTCLLARLAARFQRRDSSRSTQHTRARGGSGGSGNGGACVRATCCVLRVWHLILWSWVRCTTCFARCRLNRTARKTSLFRYRSEEAKSEAPNRSTWFCCGGRRNTKPLAVLSPKAK